jgi:hypothetical protein
MCETAGALPSKPIPLSFVRGSLCRKWDANAGSGCRGRVGFWKRINSVAPLLRSINAARQGRIYSAMR